MSVRSPFSCTILSSLGTSFHPFLTLCVQPKMPEPAGSRSLSGPHVHQDSLLPSLYGQIMSLIKPVWLQAPSSSASPIPCPCRFSSPGAVSLCAQFILGSQATNPAPLPWSQRRLPRWGRQMPGGWWGSNCVPTGSRVWPRTLGTHLVLLRSW